MAYSKKNNKSNNSNSREFDPKTYTNKSGCKYGISKQGTPYVNGWKASKRFGMTKYLAVFTKATHVTTSKSGKEWANVMVKIQPENAPEYVTSGLMDMATKKVIINSLGYVMNPNASKTGYVGRFGGN